MAYGENFQEAYKRARAAYDIDSGEESQEARGGIRNYVPDPPLLSETKRKKMKHTGKGQAYSATDGQAEAITAASPIVTPSHGRWDWPEDPPSPTDPEEERKERLFERERAIYWGAKKFFKKKPKAASGSKKRQLEQQPGPDGKHLINIDSDPDGLFVDSEAEIDDLSNSEEKKKTRRLRSRKKRADRRRRARLVRKYGQNDMNAPYLPSDDDSTDSEDERKRIRRAARRKAARTKAALKRRQKLADEEKKGAEGGRENAQAVRSTSTSAPGGGATDHDDNNGNPNTSLGPDNRSSRGKSSGNSRPGNLRSDSLSIVSDFDDSDDEDYDSEDERHSTDSDYDENESRSESSDGTDDDDELDSDATLPVERSSDDAETTKRKRAIRAKALQKARQGKKPAPAPKTQAAKEKEPETPADPTGGPAPDDEPEPEPALGDADTVYPQYIGRRKCGAPRAGKTPCGQNISAERADGKMPFGCRFHPLYVPADVVAARERAMIREDRLGGLDLERELAGMGGWGDGAGEGRGDGDGDGDGGDGEGGSGAQTDDEETGLDNGRGFDDW